MCGVWNHFHNAIHPKIHDIVVKIHPKVEKSPEDVESIFHSSLEYYSGLTYNDFKFTRFQCNLKSFGDDPKNANCYRNKSIFTIPCVMMGISSTPHYTTNKMHKPQHPGSRTMHHIEQNSKNWHRWCWHFCVADWIKRHQSFDCWHWLSIAFHAMLFSFDLIAHVVNALFRMTGLEDLHGADANDTDGLSFIDLTRDDCDNNNGNSENGNNCNINDGNKGSNNGRSNSGRSNTKSNGISDASNGITPKERTAQRRRFHGSSIKQAPPRKNRIFIENERKIEEN